MYKSPIEKIYGELQTQMMQEDEKLVMKAVRKVGVNVNKDELIKALQYDRNQYVKGYEDGKNEVLDKIRAEIGQQERWLMNAGYNAYNVDIAFNAVKLVVDKYKTESEDKK